jgi:ubiquinone/menaquinone biosynthesis C-methylase UbiE
VTAPEGEFRGEWSDVAHAWERNRERIFEQWRFVSDWLIEAITPVPGQTVLELAAGPGETGLVVAERIAPTGRLISSDIVADMVEAARRGAEARGLANVECRVMDAQAIDLPDDSVDGVLCRFGLMLMANPAAVLAGVRRVLRPAGRLSYAVFGAPDRNPWITTMVGAIIASGHDIGADPFAPGGLFSLAEPDRNRQLLADSGFSDVVVDEITGIITFDDLDGYWNFQSSISGRFATLLAALDDEQRQDVRSHFGELAQPYQTHGTFALPNLVIAVAARAW